MKKINLISAFYGQLEKKIEVELAVFKCMVQKTATGGY